MDTKTQDYHISFFKPSNPRTKANRNMVILLVSVWAVAVFGFQILLKIIEKPTPEDIYHSYEAVWENIQSGNASEAEIKEFAQASLQVLSKVFIKKEEREVLDIAVTSSMYQLAKSEQQMLVEKIAAFEKTKNEIDNISDEYYISQRNELSAYASPIIGLAPNDIRADILPLELHADQVDGFTDEVKAQIPVIMDKYLIHNESVLTTASFLGFPFHYFYTAVFLLILFVFLCWLYCNRTTALNKKFGIED
jgi:putative solute:sodium symporter small subunit